MRYNEGMLVYCAEGHLQNGQSGGSPCEVCMKVNPEKISCKDPECPSIESFGEVHFHPPETYYDINGDQLEV